MTIALFGYGKMGKMIDSLLEREGKHQVALKVNSTNRASLRAEDLEKVDVAIEFSNPASVIDNINLCLTAGVRVVIGTTGWYNHLNEIKKLCTEMDGAIVYASNFSIGVNILFEINRKLAELMNHHYEYEPRLTEIHHTQKKDAPSGTAITLSNDILNHLHRKKRWVNQLASDSSSKSDNPSDLIILSRRENEVVGIHNLEYHSTTDKISITHEAFSREGFALGAIRAAEWIHNKKGVYEFREILQNL